MTRTIVVTDYDFPDLALERDVLADSNVDVDLVGAQARTPEEVIDVATDADGLLVQYASITDEVFSALELTAVGRYGIGVDTVDLDAATAHGVEVVNVPDYCVEEVPTHTLTLLLTCARKIPTYDNAIKSGEWDWTAGKPIDRIAGETLGLVGFGTLARRLVELVSGFDLEILVFDPYVDEAIEEAGCEKVSFDDLLERSRFVSVHAPLTDETRGMFDEAAFDTMRDDAFFINSARGGLVEPQALFDAIDDERIAGAGIDVLPTEPPEEVPPFDHDNIVYTPHVAWYSEDSITDLRRTVTKDVLGIIRGEPPINPVNGPLEE